jgi:hypothetical protein
MRKKSDFLKTENTSYNFTFLNKKEITSFNILLPVFKYQQRNNENYCNTKPLA